MSDPAPWSHQLLEPELNQKLLQVFHGERDGFIEVGPRRFFFPKRFLEDGHKYKDFAPRASDIWVVTFPRSGTTLTQELVWLLCNPDYETAAAEPLTERFPFLEFESCVNKNLFDQLLDSAKNDEVKKLLLKVTDSATETLERVGERRFIKTHLPLSLLHPDLLSCGAKVIYVARNPKDVAVSYFHLHQLFKTLDYRGTFEQFWDLFEQDKLQWCPFWEHINEAWALRDDPNLLFLFYEDMQKNLTLSIEKIARFLDVTASEAEISKLAKHLDIRTFRQNPSVNFENLRELGLLNETEQRFIRKGESGKSITMFSPELNQRAEEWIQKNLGKTSLRFPN